jgi:hypothetical protein
MSYLTFLMIFTGNPIVLIQLYDVIEQIKYILLINIQYPSKVLNFFDIFKGMQLPFELPNIFH